MEQNERQVMARKRARLGCLVVALTLGLAVGMGLVLALVPESLELECLALANAQAATQESGERARPETVQIRDAVERSAKDSEGFLAKAYRCQQAQ